RFAMITFNCQCGKQLKAPDEFTGRQTRCPGCGQSVTVPPPGELTQALPAPTMGQQFAQIAASPPESNPFTKPKTSGKAAASLVLGIVSLGLPCLAGVPLLIVGVTLLAGFMLTMVQLAAVAGAVVLGFIGLSAIKRSEGKLGGKGLA